ncbi:MAG: hypothetical protein FJ197_10535 [Gammaproteobacteria bacterium]|nr:hypothetical protein [Gammaproteobacteria bacterium]
MSTSSRTGFFGKPVAAKSSTGKTRVCPHCKTTILDSAAICPACRKYLRFESGVEMHPVPDISPLKVAATIQHPAAGEPWEYSVVFTVRNEKGEEISRQVVGVGALQPLEQRSFNLAVEVFRPTPKKK